MTNLSDLGKCNDVSSINKFIATLDNDEIQFNGREYVNLKTHDSLKLDEITKKFRLALKYESYKNPLHVHEEVSGLIHKLKNISFRHCKEGDEKLIKSVFSDVDSNLGKIRSACKMTICNNDTAIHAILNNYNRLVKEVNSKIEDKVGPNNFGAELDQIEYLSDFLGIEWDSQYSAGKALLPLVNTDDIIEAPAPESLRPQDCASLGALYTLVKKFHENKTPLTKKEVNEIEVRLLLLYQSAVKSNPFIKSDMQMQVVATLFFLDKLIPGYKQAMSAKINKINQECIQGIKHDPKSMARIQIHYNTLARIQNDSLESGVLRDDNRLLEPPIDEIIWENDLLTIDLLNTFLEFPLTQEHFKKIAIFPTVIDSKNPEELYQSQEKYNFYSLLLNHEMKLRDIHERYNQLEREFDPDICMTLMMDPSEQQIKKEELDKLKNEIKVWGNPMNSSFIESVSTEQKRLKDLLGIKHSVQRKYPVIGRDLSLPLPVEKFDRSDPKKLIAFAERYNLVVSQMHCQREYCLKQSEYLEYVRSWREKDPHELWYALDEVFLKIDSLQNEIDIIKNSPHFMNSDRLILWKLSPIYLLAEKCELVKFTDKQKSGEESLPLVDIDKLRRDMGP